MKFNKHEDMVKNALCGLLRGRVCLLWEGLALRCYLILMAEAGGIDGFVCFSVPHRARCGLVSMKGVRQWMKRLL